MEKLTRMIEGKEEFLCWTIALANSLRNCRRMKRNKKKTSSIKVMAIQTINYLAKHTISNKIKASVIIRCLFKFLLFGNKILGTGFTNFFLKILTIVKMDWKLPNDNSKCNGNSDHYHFQKPLFQQKSYEYYKYINYFKITIRF